MYHVPYIIYHNMTNTKENKEDFHDRLKRLMDEYVHLIYDVTASFPKDEIYGATSQLRRSGLSIVLNYVEGFARRRKAVLINFLEISYGSLQESIYLVNFSYKRKWISDENREVLTAKSNEIGKMLWGTISKLT